MMGEKETKKQEIEEKIAMSLLRILDTYLETGKIDPQVSGSLCDVVQNYNKLYNYLNNRDLMRQNGLG